MDGNRYRHIFLEGPKRTQGFTNPRRGGPSPNIPDRNRAQHGQYLRQRLDAAWAEVDQRQAVAHVQRDGAYIEFLSEPGFDLMIESLEARKSGIRLLNVRRSGDPGSGQTTATVYIPLGKRSHFLSKITAYESQQTKSGEPKNRALINNISDIRAAILESFWQDNPFLLPADTPEWVEVWLNGEQETIVDRFRSLLSQLHIMQGEGLLRFPERTILVILASKAQLEKLIEISDDVAEFRLAKEVAPFFVEMENRRQLQLVRGLLDRTRFDDAAGVSVCILDTGVNNGHLLIRPVLDGGDLHTVRPHWKVDDHDGHGTLMAGTVAYGDLSGVLAAQGAVRVVHRLESAKILPPPPETNSKRLWGDITSQGISRAEIHAPNRKRIICMAVTATDDRDRGRPSSWSGAIDRLASGYSDDKRRLLLISAGNVDDPDNWRNYPDDNLTNEVHDPGQAWNALTVGAFTQKTRIADPKLSGFLPIAPPGGLSPFSTTSFTWPSRKWPIKPEVVFEGGNAAYDQRGSAIDPDDLKLLSTYRDPQKAQFAPFCGTSAACAQAAWMAAQIQALYPNAWPETIRALIVHSARWTDAMRVLKERFQPGDSKDSVARFLRVCGYGAPDLEKALYCLANSLTLISQAELQPYDKKSGESRYVTRDMHLYDLPWPRDILASLGELRVTMRITLSYFIEPSPGEVGWDNRYRYASHALRFDVNGPSETEEEFVRRVNKLARDDGEHPGTEGVGSRWMIGGDRNVGSIHSDIWRGTAAELAESNKIAVYPAVGWWRERSHLNRWNRKCRYSLVVSIHSPRQDVDIYTPVAVLIGLTVPIVISASQGGAKSS